MTSFPRTETDPGFSQMLCDCCCLPVIRVFKKIDFGILLSRLVLPTPLKNLKSSHYSDDLLPALAWWYRILTGMLMGPFIFMFTFCFITENSQKDCVLIFFSFLHVLFLLQFRAVSGLSLLLVSYLPRLVSF